MTNEELSRSSSRWVCCVSSILLWLTTATEKKTHMSRLLVITHMWEQLCDTCQFNTPPLFVHTLPHPLCQNTIYGWDWILVAAGLSLFWHAFLFGLSKKLRKEDRGCKWVEGHQGSYLGKIVEFSHLLISLPCANNKVAIPWSHGGSL